MTKRKDFWDKMGLCLSCLWLEVEFNDLKKRPELYKCGCYRGMPLRFFRRQKKCINYTYES